MTDNELGKALLNLEPTSASSTADSQLAAKLVAGDRRRILMLTISTILIWLVAAVLVVWVFVAFGLLFPKQAKLRQDVTSGKIDEATRESVQVTHQVAVQMITLGVAGSVGALGLATLFTVFLVLASRRATLRQINANLAEISQQLKQVVGTRST